MRITNRMMVENSLQNIANSKELTSKLQNQISTGKQVQNASDDPVRASLSLSLRSNLRTIDSYVDTTDSTNNWMNASDFTFGQLETLSNRASTLVLRGLNDTISGQERATTLGSEMKTLVDQAVEIGNTTHNGQYIFAGYKLNTKPFALTNAATTFIDFSGNTVNNRTVTYSGDSNVMQRSLGPEQSVTLNVPGDQAIQGFLQNLVLASEALTKNPYDPASLQTALAGLQSSLSTLDQFRTSNGARMRQVESAAEFLDQVKAETKSLLSKKEDANVAEAITMLASQKITFDAVLEVSKRAISGLSLFDYIQ
ncbi:MAG: flagellar hook-associated protein FlgL [Chloroflexi bacterium]|nr:flagellar hook-associated protein FlgL [Chloroflexota bacterium]